MLDTHLGQWSHLSSLLKEGTSVTPPVSSPVREGKYPIAEDALMGPAKEKLIKGEQLHTLSQLRPSVSEVGMDRVGSGLNQEQCG